MKFGSLALILASTSAAAAKDHHERLGGRKLSTTSSDKSNKSNYFGEKLLCDALRLQAATIVTVTTFFALGTDREVDDEETRTILFDLDAEDGTAAATRLQKVLGYLDFDISDYEDRDNNTDGDRKITRGDLKEMVFESMEDTDCDDVKCFLDVGAMNGALSGLVGGRRVALGR